MLRAARPGDADTAVFARAQFEIGQVFKSYNHNNKFFQPAPRVALKLYNCANNDISTKK
jgi:hypothetical protein